MASHPKAELAGLHNKAQGELGWPHFLSARGIAFRRNNPMLRWRRPIAGFLSHNSSSAIEFFRIPVERVIEIRIRVEL
ncbi:MAG: hypothetical protein ABL933_15130 [Methyloglobulus sp.]|nr:hypothetical protein [Methyloglobulus sp.]